LTPLRCVQELAKMQIVLAEEEDVILDGKGDRDDPSPV
jgi:hypothetical protein